MSQLKQSDILYGILIVFFLGLVAAVFTLPQEVLDNNEIYFLLVIAFMGFLWIRAYVNGMRGN
jgi:Na+-driven multidrug efflux pump